MCQQSREPSLEVRIDSLALLLHDQVLKIQKPFHNDYYPVQIWPKILQTYYTGTNKSDFYEQHSSSTHKYTYKL